MLTALLLTLVPEKNSVLPISHGELTHAAMLDIVLRRDAKLARQLHEPSNPRSFTVSLLRKPVDTSKGETAKIISLFSLEASRLTDEPTRYSAALPAGMPVEWRITGLNEQISGFLRELKPGWGIRIGQTIFEVTEIMAQSSSSPEAGTDQYGCIVERWMNCREQDLPQKFQLECISPTAFRTSGKSTLPFPVPGLLWPGLLDDWNRWTSAFCPQLSLALREDVLLTNWWGKTKRVSMSTRQTTGCIGRFLFHPESSKQVELRRLMAILADFSFFAGAGWQTSAGMGQIRWRKTAEEAAYQAKYELSGGDG